MSKENKTNVMRVLDQKKIPYTEHFYEGVVSGVDVANYLGEDPKRCFKTLVTVAASKAHYVFIVPVDKTLDLKKAAKAVDEKSVSMIKQDELLPLTGYVHGGCSPIGMKKQFKTVIDETAIDNTIFISAGKIGYQVELKYEDLKKAVPLKTADITI
ncbi:MAG: Cys-tRNA(Pro) deacylase [Clostridia bacterium]|nr:Cys-tRNA(Pro) deacylase [Clostridia bacterium]